MNLWPLLLTLACMVSTLPAATVIANYSGGVDPTTLQWRGSNTANTNVQFESVFLDNRQAWKITDPGVPVSETLSNNSQYYYQSYTATTIQAYAATGWDLSFTMKVPDLTEMPGSDWARDSSSMVGIYWVHPTLANTRVSFSIQTGRDTSGNTTAALNGLNAVFTLTPEFHDYKMSYRDGTVSLYIDGELKGTSLGSIATSTSTSNLLYWGDNNNTTTAYAKGPRSAYYSNVNFSTVPEPSRAWIAFLGVASVGLMRRRPSSLNRYA